MILVYRWLIIMYIVVPTGLTHTYGLKKKLCGQWRSSIRDGPGHARLDQNPPHRCRAASPRGAGSWPPRRHGVHPIQEDCWEVPTQEPWEIRIWGVSCRRWDGLLISKGAIPIESPLLDGFFGGSSWIINCSALGFFRHGWMKYLN